MSGKNKHIGLRCTDEILYKLKYISEYEGRSLNGGADSSNKLGDKAV